MIEITVVSETKNLKEELPKLITGTSDPVSMIRLPDSDTRTYYFDEGLLPGVLKALVEKAEIVTIVENIIRLRFVKDANFEARMHGKTLVIENTVLLVEHDHIIDYITENAFSGQ